MKRLLIINGPNLNMLGQREPEVYGHQTLADLEALCTETATAQGLTASCFQSNSEGEIVTRLQQADFDGLVINPAAYSHTSIAIADALRVLSCPMIEVHLSNIYKREAYRHQTYTSTLVDGVITGLGPEGYRLAIQALASRLT